MSKEFYEDHFLIDQGQIFNIIIYVTFMVDVNLFLNNFEKPKNFSLTYLHIVKEKYTQLLLLK